MAMLKQVFISLRPKQWYKNLLIFVGIVFSMNLGELSMWVQVIPAFVIFCALSGSEYLINDVLDSEKDKRHTLKSKRPIPSGKLKPSTALAFAVALTAAALAGAYFINVNFLIISAAYVGLSLCYSLLLKRIILIDIVVLAIGFVVRAMAGALAIGVFISPWLIICTFLLALVLVLGKRRHEIVLLGNEAEKHREILAGYSTEMLEQMINIATGALIVCYLMYTFFTDNYYMMFTIPFAVYGLFRYLFLVHRRGLGGEPEMIFTDKAMLINLLLWGGVVVLILILDKSGVSAPIDLETISLALPH